MKGKRNWKISCEIIQGNGKGLVLKTPLSFTVQDFQTFVPPDGNVVNFQVVGEVELSTPKLRQGIYSLNQSSYSLVTQTRRRFHLIVISCNWTGAKELLCRLLSSAGMEPNMLFVKDSPVGEIISDWSRIIRSAR